MQTKPREELQARAILPQALHRQLPVEIIAPPPFQSSTVVKE